MQEHRLHVQGQLADFVEEQRAAVGLNEGALAIRNRPRESPTHVTQERGFDKILGLGGAVEDHEGLVGAGTVAVNLLGEKLLARPGLAFEQHGGLGMG
jgi:hypothetical protein